MFVACVTLNYSKLLNMTNSPIRFKVEADKIIASALYLLDKLGKTDFHKIFKILYFAEQDHLVNWGRPITGDVFIAMKNGPVPSNLYDIFKHLRGDGMLKLDHQSDFQKHFLVEPPYMVTGISKPELDNLATSEIESLEKSIRENVGLTFAELTDKSHDAAWNQVVNEEIDFIEIARAGGADKTTVDFIYETASNQRLFDA